ncbi:MAG TPA: YdcF family protein [Beijerinckiaceae bacterium]|nr:YdcF family protein [Beijerinckiaceae bacterium]
MFFYLSKIFWFLATPSNLLACLALLGAVLAFTRWRRLGAGLATGAAAAILVLGLSPLASFAMLALEERFPPTPLDAPFAGAIVLGGAVEATDTFDRGQLVANEAAERIFALLALARHEPPMRIVYSGGPGLRRDETEAAAVARHLGALGIDPDRVLWEDRARNTRENAVFAREMVAPKPGERWLLVTSAWHMPRSIGVFRQAGFSVVPYPVDYRTGGAAEAAVPFRSVSDGLRRFDVATREWMGLLAYRLAGYTDALFPAPDPAMR